MHVRAKGLFKGSKREVCQLNFDVLAPVHAFRKCRLLWRVYSLTTRSHSTAIHNAYLYNATDYQHLEAVRTGQQCADDGCLPKDAQGASANVQEITKGRRRRSENPDSLVSLSFHYLTLLIAGLAHLSITRSI